MSRKAPIKVKKTANKVTYKNPTPPGEKPNLDEFPQEYFPSRVECAWYSWWDQQGFFKSNSKSDKKFVMLLPPPNASCELQLRNVISCSIEDALTRYHRMNGDDTLWLPSTDHAGIATQIQIDQIIQQDKKISKCDITRDDFLNYAYPFIDKNVTNIKTQLQILGSSLDWTRYFYTLDEQRSKAVTEAFIRLFNKGKIFYSKRIVNWDCTLQSAISDTEVEYTTIKQRTLFQVPGHKQAKYPFGVLTYFKYQIADENGQPTSETIDIATTRLETILGDEAVAVHSRDKRYEHLHGKRVYHPFRKTTIPIIIDDQLVDMDFGTGAVKVTPAHDPNDYVAGIRNKLPLTNIFTDDGKINEIVPEFTGMARYDARIAIKKDLQILGLFSDEKDHEMRIGFSTITHDIIEPVVKEQWFVDTNSMEKRTEEAFYNNDLKVYQFEFVPDWKECLQSSGPWCISRKLYWGHQIPAYRVFVDGNPQTENNEWVAAHDKEEALKLACEKVNIEEKDRVNVVQDENVLDTWFSASLLPFTSLGWPDNTEDLSHYYPVTILESGLDILKLWVHKVVMMSLEINDKLPFDTILLHPVLKCEQEVNPFQLISGLDDSKDHPQIGADALRMALISFVRNNKVSIINVNAIVSYRNFCNKIWNSIKFALPKFDGFDVTKDTLEKVIEAGASLRIEDKWILNKLNSAIKASIEGFEKYFSMSDAVLSAFHFFQDELCSVYLETTKPIMNGEDEGKKKLVTAVLYECMETFLRMIHPYMPFITEDLWQRLPKRFDSPSIMISPYPSVNQEWSSYQVGTFDNSIKIATAIRKIKHVYNIKSNDMKAQVASNIPDIADTFDSIHALVGVGQIENVPFNSPTLSGYSSEVVSELIQVRLDLNGLIDFEKELDNVKSKKDKLLAQFNKLNDKISAPFYNKVPPKVQEAEKGKLEAYRQQIAALEETEAKLNQALEAK